MIWAVGVFIFILFLFLFPILLGKPERQLDEVKRSFEIRDSQLKRDFQFQSKELQRRLKSGDLAQDEWQQLNDELAKDTSHSLAGSSTASESGINKTMPIAFVSVIMVIVAIGYLVYYYVGFYDESNYRKNLINVVSNSTQAIENYRQKASDLKTQEALTDFYLALRVKADIEPDNYENWRELSYFNSNYGREKEAKAALRIAQAVAPNNLDLKVDEAQMLTVSGETGDVIKGHKIISEVLKADPNNQGALLVRANSAYRVGMYDLAIMSWKRLLTMADENSAMYKALENRIKEAEQQQSGNAVANHGQQNAKPDAHAHPEPTEVQQPVIDGIRVSVLIDDELLGSLSGNEMLFVFARAIEGPQFPIAAVRTTVADLGNEIILSDAQSMQAQFALSKFDEVRIVARISRSGSPKAVSGDIEGESGVIKKPYPQELQILMLDKVVP